MYVRLVLTERQWCEYSEYAASVSNNNVLLPAYDPYDPPALEVLELRSGGYVYRGLVSLLGNSDGKPYASLAELVRGHCALDSVPYEGDPTTSATHLDI